MSLPERHRFKWNMNEINKLHSEYELKEYNVYSIAHLHKRTVYAILSKLSDEGLIEPTWIDARGYNSTEYQTYSMEKDSFDSDDEKDSEYVSHAYFLRKRCEIYLKPLFLLQ